MKRKVPKEKPGLPAEAAYGLPQAKIRFSLSTFFFPKRKWDFPGVDLAASVCGFYFALTNSEHMFIIKYSNFSKDMGWITKI